MASKTLFVSDFDDTLAQTDAKINVTRNGKRFTLTPEEYAVYEEQPGDTFDFSEFDKLINPRPIQRFVSLLKKAIRSKKADKITVLTARGHTGPVAEFLKMVGVNKGVSIAAIGDNNPQRKANYIEKHIQSGYNRVAFIDDSPKNVTAVKQLRAKYPKVKLLVHQAKKSEEPKQQKTKRISIKQLLRSKVTNPKTGQKIFLQTALRNKDHPAYKQAMGMVSTYAKKHNIKVK
jgi:hypothetical protein